MPLISNVDQILQHADIVDVIGRRLTLKRNGAEYSGSCPFHQSKSGKSFTVSPDKGLWYCHGCQVGGDTVKFLQEFEHLEWRDAMEVLAGECGIRVEYGRRGNDGKPTPNPIPDGSDNSADSAVAGWTRQDLYEACAKARDWYRTQLFQVAEAPAAALTYICERGFSAGQIQTWQFGYARGDGVSECGADPDCLVAAGILRRAEDGRRLYDPLAARLIIPLHDHAGRVVAFTGRALAGSTSDRKYMNTSDTPIFKKSHHLFGYHAAREALRSPQGEGRSTSPCIHLLEGQLKAIAVLEAGLPAVAPGGTDLSERQAAMLARLTDTVCICPDPDEAGVRACVRNAGTLRAAELNVTVGHLVQPAGMAAEEAAQLKDPDDYAAAGLKIEYAHVPFIEWAYTALVCAGPADTAEKARLLATAVLPLVASHPLPTVQAVELSTLARCSGIAEPQIRSGLKSPGNPPNTHTTPAGDRTAPGPASTPLDTRMTAGRYLCAVLLQAETGQDPHWWSRHVRWTELPLSLVETLQLIAWCKLAAARRSVPVATVIAEAAPAGIARYLQHWLSVKLPQAPDLAALQVIEQRVVEQYAQERRAQFARHGNTAALAADLPGAAANKGA